MRPSRRKLLAVAGAWFLLVGCSRTETVTLDLLPAGTTARVEAALRVPPEAKLRLNLEIAPTAESDGTEAVPDSLLEVWVHTGRNPRGHLFERLALNEGENRAVVDLERLERREVLLQLVPKGQRPDDVTWREAQLEGTVGGKLDQSRPYTDHGMIQADVGSPNIILYVVDTLRADALGVYGAARPTPWIDAFANEGVRFAHALTTATWTRPATASLLTGLYPSTHTAEDRPDRLPESSFTLAERLRLLGYSTAAVVANGNVDPVWGFDQGFEFFVRPEVPDLDAEGNPRRHLHAEEAHEVALREWTRRVEGGSGPVFLYVHTVDPHGPYDPPEWLLSSERPELGNTNPILVDLNLKRREPTDQLMSALRTLYAGEVAYTDREFGKFLSALGPLSHSVIAFTSDHGEGFQEHGYSSHGLSLYQEELQVPLMLWGPGRLPVETVVEEPVSLIDVVPTLLSLAGAPISRQDMVHGASLEELWASGSKPSELHQRPLMSELDYDGRRWESLRMEADKLMVHLNTDRSWLFDLRSDPPERHNLIPELGEESRDRLRAVLAEIRDAAMERRLQDPEGTVENPLSEDAIEHLRALGYVQ